jgi:hypothetical protein
MRLHDGSKPTPQFLWRPTHDHLFGWWCRLRRRCGLAGTLLCEARGHSSGKAGVSCCGTCSSDMWLVLRKQPRWERRWLARRGEPT